MNDHSPSNTLTKAPTIAIQLVLTGVGDITHQPLRHQLDTPGPCIAPRILKVVETGDFWAKRTMPSIRLQGKWMLRAGVLPNRHVQITNPSPGVLQIQLLEDTPQTAQVGLQTSYPKPPKNQTTIRRPT